ncbi:MAG: response regulator [Rhizobiaceae bacterium]|jgi:CheY-like chemotaxis protein
MEPLKVLIIEDEALLAMELEDLVQESGHTVVGWATSSREALDLVDTVEADVAFVDVHLVDGPTGTAVADHIHKNRRSMVVFLTANPKRVPDDFAGAVGVIAKPYTMSGLISALRYLHEGVRRPPPASKLPVGFTLFSAFASAWGV